MENLEKNGTEKKRLNVNLSYPFATYQLFPQIYALLRRRTIFIRASFDISKLENKRITSVNIHSFNQCLLTSVDPSKLPKLFLLCTNPIPYEAIWANELKFYFESLTSTYKVRTNYRFESLSFPTFDDILLDPLNVVTFLSMGKESLWSLSKTIENKLYTNIIVVFIYGASWGGRDRERSKFFSFIEWFQRNKVDYRVKFFELEYERYFSY